MIPIIDQYDNDVGHVELHEPTKAVGLEAAGLLPSNRNCPVGVAAECKHCKMD